MEALETPDPAGLNQPPTSHESAAALRFYPDTIPAFDHEPTRERFMIARDPAWGEGVVSLTSFAPGDIIFAFTGFFSAEVTQFTLQIAEGLHLHDPYFYGKILHSCAPNASVDVNRRVFVALRDIRPGQPVTMDYAQTEDYLFRTFDCCCGASACRGFVTGRKQVPEGVLSPASHVLNPGALR